MDDQYLNDSQATTDEPYEVFDLKVPDHRLIQMVSNSFKNSVSYWNNEPFELDKNDRDNLGFFFGQKLNEPASYDGVNYKDNRMLTSTRAVLAYVNARVAMPDITPSNGEESAKQFARDMRGAMYQHGVDHNLKVWVKKATTNLVVRKRGFLKLRFDPTCGPYGDVIPEHIDPSEIVVDKFAIFSKDPPKIFHRQRCTIEELIDAKFPAKKDEIYKAFGYKRGVYTQISRMTTYYETWFTFFDKGMRQEGLMWWLPHGNVILGKMLNPNWIYTGDPLQDRIVNFAPYPIKPFTVFNYLNSGKSYIDETSLFEQARPLQSILLKRGHQIMENADYANGRVIADGNAMTEEDATKYLNKRPKTIMLIKPTEGQNVTTSVYHIPHSPLPDYVIEDKYDLRNEIDQIMGTPNIFRGEQSKNNTLGQDERIIQQAGALQDDLASSVDDAMGDYYRKLYQMMKVYYTEDHWFQMRGDDGKYDFITLNSDTIDTNVKVSVEANSTLPANKQEMRDTALDLAKLGKIDDLTLFEDLGLPDAEKRAERLIKYQNDPASYLSDVEQQLFSREADTDIALLIANEEPPERDEYGQAYLEYFNRYIMGNKFIQLPPDAQERIKIHLAAAGMTAARTANLQATQTDDAAMAGVPEEQVQEVM